MATKKSSSSSSSKKTTTTPKQTIGTSNGQSFFVGGTPAPSSSNAKTSSSSKKSSGSSKTVSYYDVDGNPDTKSDGSGLKLASTPPGLKINSKGQATTSAGVVSQDRMGMLPGTPGSSQGLVTPTGPVTTSDPATTAVGNLNNQISQGLNNPPVSPMPGNPMGQYNPAFDPSKDLAVQKEIQEGNKIYADRQKELKAERDAAIADLKVSMQVDKAQLAENQRKQTGVTNRNLAYLQQGGQSASAQAYMNELEIGHSREQANLTAKYNSAILAARTAYSEKDFQLADAMVKNAQQIKKDAYQRNQDFLDNALKINNFIMEQKKFQFQQEQYKYEQQNQAKEWAYKHSVSTPFYFVGGVGYDTSTGEALSYDEYIARGGNADFRSNATVIEYGSELERSFVMDLAAKYPDAPIDIMNDDVATARKRIEGSRIYQDQVRPPSSGGGGGSGSRAGLVASFLQAAKSDLDAERASSKDGFANPDTYRAAKAAYISEKGSATNFFQMFPPEVYIHPSNRKGDLDVYKKESSTQDEEFSQFMSEFVNG